MNINISGQQIKVGQSLQTYVQEVLTENIHKYLERATHADVHFSKEAFLYKCDIVMNKGVGDGVVVNVHATAKDIYHAFDLAVSYLKKQLIKYKDKLKHHHHNNKEIIHDRLIQATKYVVSSQLQEQEIEDNPIIIAEKSTNISYLSVSEAVMRMDLLGLPALMFKNRANDRLNLVYYREDGNISWIDPQEN